MEHTAYEALIVLKLGCTHTVTSEWRATLIFLHIPQQMHAILPPNFPETIPSTTTRFNNVGGLHYVLYILRHKCDGLQSPTPPDEWPSPLPRALWTIEQCTPPKCNIEAHHLHRFFHREPRPDVSPTNCEMPPPPQSQGAAPSHHSIGVLWDVRVATISLHGHLPPILKGVVMEEDLLHVRIKHIGLLRCSLSSMKLGTQNAVWW